MWEILKKLHEDTYNPDGTEKVDHTVYDFSMFKNVPLPKPTGTKNYIVLCCSNVGDGVGDLGHLMRYYHRVKAIVGDSYEIKVALKAEKYHPSQNPHKKVKTGYDVNSETQDKAIEQYKAFCKTNHLEPIIHTDFLENNDPNKAKMTELISNAAAIFNISYGDFISRYTSDRPDIFKVSCHELTGHNNFNHFDGALESGAMGLGSRNTPTQTIYGIDIDEGNSSTLNFKSAQGLALLDKLKPSEEMLQTHKLMPGYPQTPIAAQNFILTGVLKNTQNETLQHDCDFFLPKDCIKEDELITKLKALNIKEQVEIITPNDSRVIHGQASENGKKVRLFVGFYLDDQEYKDLFRARTDIGLGSGDNTIMQVISSPQLPYFYANSDTVESFVSRGLGALVKDMANDQLDLNLKNILNKFSQYITLVTSFRLDFRLTEGLNPYDSVNEKIEFNFNKINRDDKKYLKYIRDLSAMAADPDVSEAWKHVHAIIGQEYNYNARFADILTGALYLNNPYPENSPTLYDFVPSRFAHFHQARQKYTNIEIDFLISPAIKALLEKGAFENEDALLEYIRKFAPKNTKDTVFIFKQVETAAQGILDFTSQNAQVRFEDVPMQFIVALSVLDLIESPAVPIKIKEYRMEDLPNALTIIKVADPSLGHTFKELCLHTMNNSHRTNLRWILQWAYHADGNNSESELLRSVISDLPTLKKIPTEVLLLIASVLDIKLKNNLIEPKYGANILALLKNEFDLRSDHSEERGFYIALLLTSLEFNSPVVAKEAIALIPTDDKKTFDYITVLTKYITDQYEHSDPAIRKIMFDEIRSNNHYFIITDNIILRSPHVSLEQYTEGLTILKADDIILDNDILLKFAACDLTEPITYSHLKALLKTPELFKNLSDSAFESFKNDIEHRLKPLTDDEKSEIKTLLDNFKKPDAKAIKIKY